MNNQEKIEVALQSIRPYLQKDGGDVEFIELTEDNTVKVRLLGACVNCDMSKMTLKAGIEESIKNVFPELNKLLSV
ncbi:NifU family protein [Putridiphycobacter roseus]|uniref:NifU family protein n=1 Tax=Putridiphycobacter roseus TaxID=2219161 RepID=A0A2W1NSS1_9FLAO|nr:NifU family protein [Putridiphycobacter roseus]PZE18692.1 NifU family protein [Putridiphycobacter roseus]